MQRCAACQKRPATTSLREPYFYDADFDPYDGLRPLRNLYRLVLACPHCGQCYLHRLEEGNMYCDYDEHHLEMLPPETSEFLNCLARRPLDLPALAAAVIPAACETHWLAAVPPDLIPIDFAVTLARDRLAHHCTIAWAYLGSRADLPPNDRDFFLAAATELLTSLRDQRAEYPHIFGLQSPEPLQFLRHRVAHGDALGAAVALVESLAPHSVYALAVLVQRYLAHPDAAAVRAQLPAGDLQTLTDPTAERLSEPLDHLLPILFSALKIELDRPAGVRPDSRHIPLILSLLRALARGSPATARNLYRQMSAAGLDRYATLLPALFQLDRP